MRYFISVILLVSVLSAATVLTGGTSLDANTSHQSEDDIVLDDNSTFALAQ